jgi:hypothetical protein
MVGIEQLRQLGQAVEAMSPSAGIAGQPVLSAVLALAVVELATRRGWRG